jgi:hypothetical protein
MHSTYPTPWQRAKPIAIASALEYKEWMIENYIPSHKFYSLSLHSSAKDNVFNSEAIANRKN